MLTIHGVQLLSDIHVMLPLFKKVMIFYKEVAKILAMCIDFRTTALQPNSSKTFDMCIVIKEY